MEWTQYNVEVKSTVFRVGQFLSQILAMTFTYLCDCGNVADTFKPFSSVKWLQCLSLFLFHKVMKNKWVDIYRVISAVPGIK